MKTKLEELRAAYEAATPGEWDFAVVNNDCPVRSLVTNEHGDALLRHKFGVSARAQHDVSFIALAHNLMPQLLEAVDLLKKVSTARAHQDHEFDVDAWYVEVRATLEALK